MFNQKFELTDWTAAFNVEDRFNYRGFYEGTAFEKQDSEEQSQPGVEALEERKESLFALLKSYCKDNLGALYTEDDQGIPTDWKVSYLNDKKLTYQAAMRVVLSHLLVKVTNLLQSDAVTAMRTTRSLFEENYSHILQEIVMLELYTHPLRERSKALYMWINCSLFECESDMVTALDRSLNYTGYSVMKADKDIQAQLSVEVLKEEGFSQTLLMKWKQLLSYCNNHLLLIDNEERKEFRIPKAMSSTFLQLLSRIGAGLPESQMLSVSTAIYNVSGQEGLVKAARSSGTRSIYQSMDQVVEDFFRSYTYNSGLGGYIRKEGLVVENPIVKIRPIARVNAYLPRSTTTLFGVEIPHSIKLELERLERMCPYSMSDVLTGRIPAGTYNMQSVLMRYSRVPITINAQGPLGVVKDFLKLQMESGVSKDYLLSRSDLHIIFSCEQSAIISLIQTL